MLETNSQVCQVAPVAANKKRERNNKGGRSTHTTPLTTEQGL